MKRRQGNKNTPERMHLLFGILAMFRLKDATVPELRDLFPEYPPASLYLRIYNLRALHWLNKRGKRRGSKRMKKSQVWGITRAGIIMLDAWENAEEYLRLSGL